MNGWVENNTSFGKSDNLLRKKDDFEIHIKKSK